MTDKLRDTAETTVEALINASDALRDGDDAGCRWILYEQIYALRQALADTGKRQTMTASELADRIKRGEKWALAEPTTFEASADALRTTPLRQALDQLPDTTKMIEEPPNSATDVVEAEPVAWVLLNNWENEGCWPEDCFSHEGGKNMTPLYTAPPKREWVGLTDDEIAEVGDLYVEGTRMLPYQFARAIEAKLKEKNT